MEPLHLINNDPSRQAYGMTIEEAAAALGCSTAEVIALVIDGTIPTFVGSFLHSTAVQAIALARAV